MHRLARRFSTIAALAMLPVLAQAAPSADLARYYFASPQDELKAREQLTQKLSALEKTQKTFTTSASVMAATLAQFEHIQTEAVQHDAYLHLRCSDDKTDSAACDGEDAVDSMVDSHTAFIASGIAALPQANIAAMLKSPTLAPYAYAIADMRRQSGHDAGAAGEAVLAKLSPDLSDWQDALYEQALSHADFGTVSTPQGALDVARQRNVLAVHPDREVRKQAFDKRNAGLDRVRDDVAFALLHTVSAGNARANLHKFANAPDAKYFAMGFDPRAHPRADREGQRQRHAVEALRKCARHRSAPLAGRQRRRAMGYAHADGQDRAADAR